MTSKIRRRMDEGEMAKDNNDKSENSVNFALQELMGMEDDRQREEEEERTAKEEAERSAREEDERQRREAEEAQRRAEDDARLAEERAAQEEIERKAREEEERKLRIKLEAESQARADEQERLLEHELEKKRIDAESKNFPVWGWVVIALFVFGAAGGLWYLRNESQKDKIAAQQKEAKLEAARVAAETKAEKEAEEAEARLKVLEAQLESMKGDIAQKDALEKALSAAKADAQKKRARAGKSRRKTKKKKSGGGLSDDPLGGLDL